MADQEEDRWTDRKTDIDGKKRQEERFGVWGDVGWHVFKTKEKKVGNSMPPQIEQTKQNESLQNME